MFDNRRGEMSFTFAIVLVTAALLILVLAGWSFVWMHHRVDLIAAVAVAIYVIAERFDGHAIDADRSYYLLLIVLSMATLLTYTVAKWQYDDTNQLILAGLALFIPPACSYNLRLWPEIWREHKSSRLDVVNAPAF